MLTYILKKMKKDKKETIGNILFVSCLLAVQIICCHVIWKIKDMVKNGWYKESMEVASIGDPFIREKMGAILWVTLVLVGTVMLFCLILYALKIKLDIVKERQRISVFQVLGYTGMQRIAAIYAGKIVELTAASFAGNFLALGIWRLLGAQQNFVNLMTMMNENMNYRFLFGMGILLILAAFGFLTVCLVIRRKENLAVVLKGEEQ